MHIRVPDLTPHLNFPLSLAIARPIRIEYDRPLDATCALEIILGVDFVSDRQMV
jgi:hypothetical protein